MDRYKTHIIGCLENAVENAVDGVKCHISAVTVQGVIDLLKERPQIVRCKDCEYRREWFCELDGHCHSPNFYCANGRRKDDDG